jgi:predicted MFS family arabinose efflux permease
MGSFVQKQKDLVKTANWGRFFFRTTIGSFALLPLLPTGIAPYVLVAARSLVSIPGAAINVSIQTIWGKATSPSRRPRMLSTRMAIHGLIAAGVGFGAGQWLDSQPFPFNYQVLFFTAFLGGLGSIWALSKLDIPEPTENEIKKQQRMNLGTNIPLIKNTPAFRNYAIAAFLFRMGMHLPMALFAIYRVRTLGSSDAWIGILLTVERLLSVFAYFALGRLLTRRKFRRWLWITTLGSALFPLTTALATTPEMLLIPSVIVGIQGAGMNIFLQNTLLAVSPEDQRPPFVAVNTFLANISAFAAPLLGTFISDLTTIQLVFIISAALRLLGGLSFWRLGVGSEK